MFKTGDTIRIINMEGEPQYNGKVGKITRTTYDPCVQDLQIWGTWGGCALYYNHDEFEIVDEK